MFQHLLLAIDDSPSSEVAVDFVTAFAKHGPASVHILHVNEYLVGGQGATLHSTEEATQLVTSAVEQLRAAGIATTGSACVSSYRHVARCIAETAHERGADTIVLGSRRRRRLGRLFTSQVRERTMRLTSSPVLVAPSPLEIKSRGRDVVLGSLDLQLEQHSPISS